MSNPEPKYTPSGLPNITDATYIALKDLIIRTPYESCTAMLEDLKENSRLYDIIQRILERGDKEFGYQFREGFAGGAALTYKLLSRQAASLKLEEELEEPSE